ncbi:hypothetical protein [Lysinibacillus sp. 54212]
MTNLLLSRFETYLLDEEVEMECYEQHEEQVYHIYLEQYPEGFFTSL